MFGIFYKCLPAMLNQCRSVAGGRCEDGGQICCSFILSLSSNQPAAPTALFTFVVAADGSMTRRVYEVKLVRWKVLL